MSLGSDILIRMKHHEAVKKDYEPLLEDIAKFVNPRREQIKDSQRFAKKGQRRGKDAFDGTPNAALGIWRDGMQGFMVSESLRWFRSEMNDHTLNDIDEVRIFLQDYDEAMYAAYRRSNFYSILPEWFGDAGSVGTAPLFVEEDIGNRTTIHTPIHLREVFIAENRYGEVDELFRKFFLTARQAVQKFDNSLLSNSITNNAESHPLKMHEFIHAVFPNNEPMFGKITSINKKYRSVYVETKGAGGADNEPNQTSDALISNRVNPNSDGVVRDSGFDIFPYAVWRFRKNSDEIYGYSPAADAIIEIFSLNQIGKTMLAAAHMAVASPLNVPEHMRGNVRMEPSGYNYFGNPKDVITPIMTGMNYPIGIDREQRLQSLIEDKYRVEFFRAFIGSTREKTATEIIKIQREQALLLSPQVNRLTDEGLEKEFDIVSDIEDKAGRLPEPPPILQDLAARSRELGEVSPIDVRFTGPLVQAQR